MKKLLLLILFIAPIVALGQSYGYLVTTNLVVLGSRQIAPRSTDYLWVTNILRNTPPIGTNQFGVAMAPTAIRSNNIVYVVESYDVVDMSAGQITVELSRKQLRQLATAIDSLQTHQNVLATNANTTTAFAALRDVVRYMRHLFIVMAADTPQEAP